MSVEELRAAGKAVFKIKDGYVAVQGGDPIPCIAFEVNGRQYTADEASELFELVCDKEDWKRPWVAAVHHSLVAAVMRAVEYYHADRPDMLGIQQGTGFVILSGHGYQAW